MNEHFDLTGYLDGFRVTYRGEVVWEGQTWTGACRAMTDAREAHRRAADDLAALLTERKAA